MLAVLCWSLKTSRPRRQELFCWRDKTGHPSLDPLSWLDSPLVREHSPRVWDADAAFPDCPRSARLACITVKPHGEHLLIEINDAYWMLVEVVTWFADLPNASIGPLRSSFAFIKSTAGHGGDAFGRPFGMLTTVLDDRKVGFRLPHIFQTRGLFCFFQVGHLGFVS
jgi:hypothetical protein